MGIVNRNITYRGRIKLTSYDLELARIGKKTCTIRLGTADVAGEIIDLTDGRKSITVRISRVDSSRPYGSLNDEDASMEGFDSKEQLKADLSRFYGEIDPLQPMTIIYFRVDDES